MSKPLGIRKCSQCGELFEIYHKKRMEIDNVCCSVDCLSLFKKAPSNVSCVVCGKEFHLKPSRIEKCKKMGVTCSVECSSKRRGEFYKGGNNPNYKHSRCLDFIYNLTNDGCYFLGLIWADGSLVKNTLSIVQKNSIDECPLSELSIQVFGKDITKIRGDFKEFVINDKDLIDFIVSLGGIKRGKKSDMIEMPNIPEDKIWSFLCGYFDGDGSFKYDYNYPSISISSDSKKMLEQVSKIWECNYTGKNYIGAYGPKALEICGKMYESCSLNNKRKYNYFLKMSNWVASNNKWEDFKYGKYKKISPEAIKPDKKRITDSGFDLHFINFDVIDEEQGLYIADSGLAVTPPEGFYYEMIGRSSLPLNNLHFAGGVGVIDKTYVGPLKMVVEKIDKTKSLPETPFKGAQLVLRRFYHLPFIKVDQLGETERGEGGFGSTGKN